MYKFKIKENGYYAGHSKNGTIPMNDEYNLDNLPTKYHFFKDEWVFDEYLAKEKQLEAIRTCRTQVWPNFDGLYLGYERDEDLSMIADCELLRQSLKDAPENAEIALAGCTTLEEIQAVDLCSVLVIPETLTEICTCYFEQ